MIYLFGLNLILLTGFSLKSFGDEGNRYILVHSGYGISSSSLSGSGFNSTLPEKSGPLYGFDIAYKMNNIEPQFFLKYKKASAAFSGPTEVTPNQLSIFREEFRIGTNFGIWDTSFLENFRLGIGYATLKTGGTHTLPNNILTHQSTQGFFIQASYKYFIDMDKSITPEILFYLPHHIQESEQITGYNPKLESYEIKTLFEIQIFDNLVGQTGISYRIDRSIFEGSGNRGVIAGQDKRTYIEIPIGFKISY